MPLYETADHNLMDYCSDENTGAPRAGCSVFNLLKKQFDDGYTTNRAPMQILVHTPWLKNKCARWGGGGGGGGACVCGRQECSWAMLGALV